MCLEDLRLGRGRFLKGPTVSTTAAAVTMPADASRVAVVVTTVLAGVWDSGALVPIVDIALIRFSASISDPDSMLIGPGTSVFVMRIEDYGNAIAGPITVSVNNQSGIAQITLASICTEVNAPPMDTYKP